MKQENTQGNKAEYALIVSLLALIIPIILLIARSHDDNRLTSWQWVFANPDHVQFIGLLFIAVLFANIFARFSLYENKPLVLFSISFLLASLFWQEPEVIVDVSRYFSQAKFFKLFGAPHFSAEWGREIFSWTDMPLIPFLYGTFFKLFGEKRIVIQIVNSIFFSGTVVLTYSFGKTLWDEELGFFAGLLLLAFPYLFTQVPLMLTDVPTMFFLMLACYLYCKALRGNGPLWILLSSLSLFLVFVTKYSTWLFLTLIPIIFFVYSIRYPLKPVFIRTTVIAALSLTFITIFLFFNYETVSQQMALLLNYQKPGLKRWGESYISTFLFQIHPFITFAAVASLFMAIIKKDLRYIIISFLVLLLIFMQIKRIRYTLPLFPFVALMAAYGIKAIKWKEVQKIVVFCAVNTSIVIALFGFLPFLQGMSATNLKDAGVFLDSLNITHAYLAPLPQHNPVLSLNTSLPILDLYTKRELLYIKTEDETPNFAKYEKSSLRFTWEYPIPEFYIPSTDAVNDSSALVVVSSEENQALPARIFALASQYKHLKVFDRNTGIFRHKTLVTIYY